MESLHFNMSTIEKSWENLNYNCLEWQKERYRIIYTWSILEQLVPNFNYAENKGGIFSYHNQRLGRKCYLKEVNTRNKNIWRDSLSEEGPRLFNALPKSIRNLKNCSKTSFKRQMDHYLNSVPDEPLLPNYFPLRRADSNNIKVMVHHRISQIGWLLRQTKKPSKSIKK